MPDLMTYKQAINHLAVGRGTQVRFKNSASPRIQIVDGLAVCTNGKPWACDCGCMNMRAWWLE